MSDTHASLESLFARLIDALEANPRLDVEDFLRDHVEHAPRLRQRLEKLRKAGFLTAGPKAGSVLHEMRERFGLVGTLAAAPPPAEPERRDELLPSRVVGGRYRILAEIGHGGMGRVFRARDVDLGREVALKVVDLEPAAGTDTAQRHAYLERFLTEAQVTAQLEHPSIVPLHDIGIDRTGQLYYTMKLVEGRTLEALIDEWHSEVGAGRPFPTGELVRILLRICDALALAHERGVIHRDLKPSNVMVGRFGEVHVMDWGVAKLTRRAEPDSGAPPSPTPAATAAGQVVGTPSYMAPEQAGRDPSRIGPRTDVYGVGTILAHALSGAPPKATTSPLHASGTPELRAVCSRAMQHDPDRRYASAAELGADLHAYLEARPGSAWRDGLARKLVKLTRRRPATVTSLAGGFLLTLGAAFAGFVYQQLGARAEELEGRRKRAQEEAERRQQNMQAFHSFVRGLVAEFEDQQYQLPLARALEASLARLDVEGADVRGPDELSRRLDRLDGYASEKLENEPFVRALVLQLVSNAYRHMGLYEEALAPQEEALDLYRTHLGEFDRYTIAAYTDAANLYQKIDRFDIAEAYERKAMQNSRDALGPQDTATLLLMSNLGTMLLTTGRYEEAERYSREALKAQQELLGEDHVHTLATLVTLGLVLRQLDRLDEAEELQRKTLQLAERAQGRDGEQALNAANNLGDLLLVRNKHAEAELILSRTVEAYERIHGRDHELTIRALSNLANAYEGLDDLPRAVSTMHDAVERCVRGLGERHSLTAVLQRNLGLMLKHSGCLDEAELCFLEALEVLTSSRGLGNKESLKAAGSLGSVYRAKGQPVEAERVFRTAYDRSRAEWGEDDPETLGMANNLCAALIDLGRLDEAEALVWMSQALAAELPGSGVHGYIRERLQEKAKRIEEERSALESGVDGGR